MVSRRSLIFSAFFAVGATAAAAAPISDPSELVPREHWAYDAVQSLAQYGFDTGRPDGTFQGRFALPRREFVRVTGYLVGEINRLEGVDPYRQTLPHRYPSRQRHLVRLAEEFLLGAGGDSRTDEITREYLKRWEAWWRGRSKPTMAAPLFTGNYPSPLLPVDEAARVAGARLAVEEWERGEVVLYCHRAPEEYGVSHPYGIPWRVLPDAGTDPTVGQRIAGHNAEMWRRLREEGVPSGSRLAWTRDLFRLNEVARAAGDQWQPLRAGLIAPAPDSELRISGIVRNDEAPAFEKFRPPTHQGGPVCSLWQLPPFAFEWLWGPSGTAILYLRRRPNRYVGSPDLLMAMDVRVGAVLNVEAVDKGTGSARTPPMS